MEYKSIDYINVIPFVDIMLVILTIVLMTSSFIVSGMIPLNLPAASNTQSDIIKTQAVEISKTGRIFINSRESTLADMKSVLDPLGRDVAIVIRADRTIGLQSFVDVLDVIKTMNFKRVTLQTVEKHEIRHQVF